MRLAASSTRRKADESPKRGPIISKRKALREFDVGQPPGGASNRFASDGPRSCGSRSTEILRGAREFGAPKAPPNASSPRNHPSVVIARGRSWRIPAPGCGARRGNSGPAPPGGVTPRRPAAGLRPRVVEEADRRGRCGGKNPQLTRRAEVLGPPARPITRQEGSKRSSRSGDRQTSMLARPCSRAAGPIEDHGDFVGPGRCRPGLQARPSGGSRSFPRGGGRTERRTHKRDARATIQRNSRRGSRRSSPRIFSTANVGGRRCSSSGEKVEESTARALSDRSEGFGDPAAQTETRAL